jgi:hypothetical protein
MKANLILFICVLLTAPSALQAQLSSAQEKRPYLIMVPPWRAIKGAANQITKDKAWAQMNTFAKSKMSANFVDRLVDPIRIVDDPAGGALIFVVSMTQQEATDIAEHFIYPGPEPIRFIVSPRHVLVPEAVAPAAKPKPGGPIGILSLPYDSNWAAKLVAPGPLDPVPDPQPNGTPVLYVVDTGVQFWVKKSVGAGNPWTAHPEFLRAMASGKLKLRQGTVRVGSDATHHWPPYPAEIANIPENQRPSLASLWEEQDNGDILSTDPLPTDLKPGLSTPPNCLDPYEDPIDHGTKITSTAIGEHVGLLGRLPDAKIEVHSIRVYDQLYTYSEDVIAGISAAIAEHIERAADGSAPSVLLLASRTSTTSNPAWSTALEIQLYFAWNKGIIVVASAGNEPSAYTTNKYSPESKWYPTPIANPSPTSPSRLDPNLGSSANWPYGSNPPMPNNPYMVLVGGSNANRLNPPLSLNYSSTAYTDSSFGPAVDMLAPCELVPCASASPLQSSQDGLVEADGTSLSTGFVAGAALAYLCTNATPSPAGFRAWLMPSAGAIMRCRIVTSGAYPSQYRLTYPGGWPLPYARIPKLEVTSWAPAP